jgi:Ca2+-binding RTX toxin-like protein
MEVLGNDPTKLYTTVHTGSNNTMFDVNGGTTVADTSAGYHTYAVDWEADKITFYFDNKQVYQCDTPADMHKPMFMLANLTVGGSWPGPVDSSTHFPADMNIDYIRAYDSNPYTNGGALPADGSSAAPAPAAPVAPAPAPAADPAHAASTPALTATAAAPVANAPGHLQGTAGADTLVGQDGVANHISGLAGSDSIVGGSQFNDINGNQGADTIIGKSVVGDWLHGGQGYDSIDASASTGANVINGNRGSDTIVGGSGADTLHGGQGDDVIHAGSGNAWISGDLGNNTIYGGQGSDIFHGSAGHDQVNSWHDGDRIQLDHGVTFTTTQAVDGVHVGLSNGGELDLMGVKLNTLQPGWIFNA